MTLTSERFIVNKKGKPVQVVLDISDYEKILEALEELDCINLYDEAKRRKDKKIPFSQAVREIENKRK
jgi:hypothetical protein